MDLFEVEQPVQRACLVQEVQGIRPIVADILLTLLEERHDSGEEIMDMAN